MKKIKMMLLSLALFAVVGAALAFKARFNIDYCTTPTVDGVACANLACPNHAISKPDPDNKAKFVCTTTYDGIECTTPDLSCTGQLRLIQD